MHMPFRYSSVGDQAIMKSNIPSPGRKYGCTKYYSVHTSRLLISLFTIQFSKKITYKSLECKRALDILCSNCINKS